MSPENNKVFVEQFPSLKNCDGGIEDYEDVHVNKEDVLKHCLDRQRVRTIIIDIMRESDWNEYKMKKKLEELGLEDEQ